MRRKLAATCVALTLAATPATASAQNTDLPQIPQALRPGQQCTPPSDRTTAEPPWQQQALGASAVWPLTTGEGVTVAVVDTGVDLPVLGGRASAVGNGGTDCVGHGTVVAGLIAAGRRADDGFAGLAPGARVLAVRGTDDRGTATPKSLATALDAAVEAGARVICVAPVMRTADPELARAVERASAAGTLVVAATGPDAEPRKEDTPAGLVYPAGFPGVLPVVAIGPDGKTTPDGVGGALAAPGTLVVGVGPGGGKVVGSGSAFAAAFVAATAALVWSYHPKVTAPEVAQRLRNTAYRQAGRAAVDPLAAVTSSAHKETRPKEERQPLSLTTPPDVTGTRTDAAVVVGAVVGTVLLLGALAVVVPRGRRRGWRGAWADKAQ